MGNIMVIGGSGFVGSALIPKLLKAKHTVTVLNRGNKKTDGVIQLKADRNSKEQLNAAISTLPENIDTVIDTSSYYLTQTKNVFELLCHKTKHWVHLSSAAVYKETDKFPKEDFPIGGAKAWGAYGVEKSKIDEFLIKGQKIVPAIILRPPYLYGPKNDNPREQFIWSRALHKEPIFIPGTGETLIQFLHVEDLADALVLCASKRINKRVAYNIASDEKMSLKDWVIATLKAGEMEAQIVMVENTAAGFTPRQYFPFRDYPCGVETGLLTKETGWQPEYNSIVRGLQQTFSSYVLKDASKKIPRSEAEVLLSKKLNLSPWLFPGIIAP